MKNIILVALLSLSINCSADEWTDADTQRETAYMVLHAIDWAQTRQIALNPEKYAENGIVARSVIGAHPSVASVNKYMVGSAILQYAIARALPSECRKVFQYVSIVDSGVSVVGNFRIGLSVRF